MSERERQAGEETLDVWSHQAQRRTRRLTPLCGVYSFGQKQLSNFTTSREALGWGIALGPTALFQRIGMRFLAAKVFFKSHCFLWLPPSRKWLCCWEWPIQRQCKTPFLQLREAHPDFSDFSAALCSQGLLSRWQFRTQVHAPSGLRFSIQRNNDLSAQKCPELCLLGANPALQCRWGRQWVLEWGRHGLPCYFLYFLTVSSTWEPKFPLL